MQLLLIKNLRDVQRRPLRTLLTVVGVLLGVAGVVAISYTGRNLAAAERQTYASTRQPDITAYVNNLSPTLLEFIAHRDNVAEVDSRATQYTRITVGDEWVATLLTGVPDFQQMPLASLELVSGHYPGRDEIAFDITSTKLTPIKLGDLVALQPRAGDPITYARVSGFVRAPATLDASIVNQASAFMPDREVRQIIGSANDNFLLARVADPQRASQTANEIQSFLDKRGVSSGSYTVRDPSEFTGSRELGTLLLLLRVFSYVGAVLSSFLVANTIAAVMLEETRQIGVIKALGGSRWDAMRTYLLFAGIIGLSGAVLGWGIGLLFGRVLSRYLAGLSGLVLPAFSFSPREVVLAGVVGLGVALSSAAIPAWLAARQRVAPLLANRGVVADFRRGFVQRITQGISRLGALPAMGLRNLARRPTRAGITLALVAASVAAFLATQALSNSVNHTVDELYDLYGADGWVYFNQPMQAGFARTLETDPDVTKAELWTTAQASIGSLRTDAWGMPEDPRIYTVRLTAGTWLRPANPVAAVLTSNLAATLQARVGDVLPLDIGKRTGLVQVVGIVDDQSTYLGATSTGKIFLSNDDLQQIAGGVSQVMALKLRSSDPAAVDASLHEVEQRFSQYHPVTLAMYRDKASSRQAINILTLMLDVMVVIVGIVGLAGIANTLLINLTERRREFGVLRALGASSRQVVRLVMTEALGLAALGCALGLLIGYPLARYLVVLTGAQLFQLDFQLGPLSILG
ncbi:MAG TPA: ABC transporter permease, partial [Thermomicrobiaceae bacterium]|nr:ABC transporter permease [Thermomicrobiaceae bacterium]